MLVKVSLASINPSDVMFLKGQYGQPRVKGQPAGFEGVGIVVAAGDDPMAQWFIGKRIAFATGLSNWGSWAEYAIAEAPACIPIIDAVRDEDAAAMIVNPLTAVAMFGIVKDEGQKAFVMTAGASQLSKLIIGLAKDEGYRPIVTVRRDDQIAPLKSAGAAHVLNHTAPDFGTQLRDVMKEEAPRVFLDAQTGPVASQLFHAMPRGLDGSFTVDWTWSPRSSRSRVNSSSQERRSKASGWSNGCANRRNGARRRSWKLRVALPTAAGRPMSRQ